MRPEFSESTYYLYKATKDPYYLKVGKKFLQNLQTHTRVKCGFAALTVRYSHMKITKDINPIMIIIL